MCKDVHSNLGPAATVLTSPSYRLLPFRSTNSTDRSYLAETAQLLTRSIRPFLENAIKRKQHATCALCEVLSAVLKQMACSSFSKLQLVTMDSTGQWTTGVSFPWRKCCPT